MKRLRIDADAVADLDGIHGYIAADNPRAADRLLDRIRHVFELLAQNPLMGFARPEVAPELRSFVVKNYVIYYRPTADEVQIARVLHGARDVVAIFTSGE